MCIKLLLLLFVWSTNVLARNKASPVELLFKWKHAEVFNIPRSGLEKTTGGHSNYLPENNIIYGISRDVVNDVIYAAIPRSAPGVPATLVMIENVINNSDLDPQFEPFPNYELNELKSCDVHPKASRQGLKRHRTSQHLDYSFDNRFDSGVQQNFRFPQCNSMERLISTYEPVLDNCGRLWVLDTGVLEYNTGNVVVKSPQLWTFDVKNGPENHKIIRRFDFPSDVIKDGTGLSGLAVDIVNNDCEETFVYIPNQLDDRIVVYDFYKDVSWFLESFSFRGDATESEFNHEGYESYFKAGVSSITLGGEIEGPGHFRQVFYTAGSSTGEYSISSKELRFPTGKNVKRDKVSLVGYRGKDSQTMAHVFDEKSGVLFFAESQSGRVRCWNSQKPLRPENLVTIYESKHFVYGSHVSIDLQGTLWFMSNSFPLFKADLYDSSRYNIRLYKAPVSEVISGTECEPLKEKIVELTKENIQKFFNINITEVITDDLLK